MSSFAKSVILFALPLADARFLQEFETIGGSMRNLKDSTCFEKNVKYLPAKNSIGYRRDYMKLLSHDNGCATKITCGFRPGLNGPEMCQIYCQREADCAFWTYMHWPDTKKHECYLQDRFASREAVAKGERERISGKKCCGECESNTDKKPGFFDTDGAFDKFLTAAGEIITFFVPDAGQYVSVITSGIKVVKTIIAWFSGLFYRRRLLQARYLQNGKEAEELTSALIRFSDEIQNDVNAIEEIAAPRRIARSSEDGLKILLSETSKIKESANRGNDKESILKALHVTEQVMKSAKGKFTTEAEKSEYSESKDEMEYLQTFFEKMEGLLELSRRLQDKKQE